MVNKHLRLRGKIKLDSGFTLIELLAVIILIGILTSIANLGYNSVLKSSRINSCRVDWSTVNAATISYASDNPNGATSSTSLTSTEIYATPQTGYSLTSLNYMKPLIDNRAYYQISVDISNLSAIQVIVSKGSKRGGAVIGTDTSACNSIFS